MEFAVDNRPVRGPAKKRTYHLHVLDPADWRVVRFRSFRVVNGGRRSGPGRRGGWFNRCRQRGKPDIPRGGHVGVTVIRRAGS